MTTTRYPHYSPFDQDAHLDRPPWSPDDPKVQAWEAAHGHDVRVKCYPEFGCQAIEAEAGRLRDALQACWDAYEAVMPDHLYMQVEDALGLRVFHATSPEKEPT